MAIWTPDEIVVSADSRGSERDGNVVTDELCKIIPFAGGYITIAGCREEDEAGYNFSTILEHEVNLNMSLSDNLYFLEKATTPLITAAANLVKNQDKEAFIKNWVEKSPLSFCIFGLEDGDLTFLYCEYKVLDADADTIYLSVRRENLSQLGYNGPIGMFVGEPKHRTEYRTKLKANSYPTTLADFSRDFVQANIDDGDGSVGGAIDTIRITYAGVEWIQKKDNCKS